VRRRAGARLGRLLHAPRRKLRRAVAMVAPWFGAHAAPLMRGATGGVLLLTWHAQLGPQLRRAGCQEIVIEVVIVYRLR
jgi:hypothetical protein